MRRLASGALYGFTAAVVTFGVATLENALDESEASQRAGIEACATNLSPEPTQNTEIPRPCSEFWFDNTETIRRVAVDGVMDETVTVEFNLPSSNKFSTYANEAVITDAQQNKGDINFVITASTISALIGLAIPPRTRKHPTKT